MLVWCSRAKARACARSAAVAGHRASQTGQDLQRHVPAERLLDRLVNNAHPPTAHLAQKAIVAQPLPRLGGPEVVQLAAQGPRGGHVLGDRPHLLHHQQSREKLEDGVGPLRIFGGVLRQLRRLASAVALEEFLG